MTDLIRTENGVSLLVAEAAREIAMFERQAKVIKDAEDRLKAAILEEMERKGVIKLDSDELTITYVAPTTRESFDSKALRSDLPDVYDAYTKLSPVKASVRIKIK